MKEADLDLLKLAAKGAGYHWPLVWPNPSQVDVPHDWNPITDDSDALRLAVKLNMTVRCYMGNTCVQIATPGELYACCDEVNHADPASATRRAIVRAAAEIGKATP